MAQAGIFAAMMALCAWIALPLPPVAFTLQTFAVLLALGLLGGKWGCGAIFLYLILGAAGLPVFSSFQGGLGVLLGASGGFLWGFLLGGLTFLALERFGRIPALLSCQAVCYICGCLWFLQYTGGGLTFVLLRCVVPFLVPDGLKLYLAWVLGRRLRRFL